MSADSKAELHVHLEGSIAPETLREIDPSLTLEEIAGNTACATFPEFLNAYKWVVQRLRTPADYALATRRLIAELNRQHVTYAEVTLSAGVVLWKEQDLEAVYDAIWEECQNAPMPVFWILDAVRQFGPEPARAVAEFAATRRNDGVVAFGLGGDEARGPALLFADIFAAARDAGLHLCCHAGETTGPESIWDALKVGSERIGHGIAAIHDPELIAHLRENQIPLEICITSNVRTGAVASLEKHPAAQLFRAGVPIILNSDDPALFGTTLNDEYEIAASMFGLPTKRLAAESFQWKFG